MPDPADRAQAAAACRRLWAEVLMVGLREAGRDPSRCRWLGSRDFYIVATCAGIGSSTEAGGDWPSPAWPA